MASTYSSNLRLELMATGANAATWGTNTNDNLSTIDAFVNGFESISVAGSSNVSISLSSPEGQASDQAANKVIELNGALTGNIYVFLPETQSNYLIYNNTSGSYTVTMAVETHEANGEAVISQSAWHWVYCEGSAGYAVKEAELGTNASTISSGTLDDARLSSNVVLVTGATFTGDVDFNDTVKANFGTGNDLQVYHDASNSWLLNSTGSVYIRNNANDSDIIIQSDDGSGGTTNYIIADGSIGEVRLFYYGAEKLNTKSDGVLVTGELEATTLDINGAGNISGVLTLSSNIDMQDNDKILLGASDDLEIYHNGSHSYLDNNTGILYIRNNTNDSDVIIQSDNGSGGTTNYIIADGSNGEVRLFHYGSEKLNTTSSGILVTGGVDMTATQGEVGTYMVGGPEVTGNANFTYNTGGTVSGSLLKPSKITQQYNNSNGVTGSAIVSFGNAQSGTWRCMGAGGTTGGSNSQTSRHHTLWFRIS